MTSLYVIALTIAIGQQLVAAQDNTYAFSYNTQGEGPANIFREERKNADGSIVGKYGYVDPNGQLRVVEYRANGPDEFQARGDIGPDSESMRLWQANLAEHERARAQVMRQWEMAAARSPPTPSWESTPVASPRSSWNPAPAAPAPAPRPRTSWNPRPAAQTPRQTWNNNPQPAPGPRTSPRLTSSWSQGRTQPPQATTSWEDGNGGSANVWSTGSAYQSFVDSTDNSNSNNQRFNRRVGESSGAGPRQRNTAASASPSFSWPEMPNGPQSLSNSNGASQPYSYGFEIQHAPAANARDNSDGGVSSAYASGFN